MDKDNNSLIKTHEIINNNTAANGNAIVVQPRYEHNNSNQENGNNIVVQPLHEHNNINQEVNNEL